MRPDDEVADFLVTQGFVTRAADAGRTPLTGGISSDLWRVDLPGRSICVKRALPRLRVAADWRAPLSRNAYECAWLRFAATHRPDNVPALLAQDTDAGLFAMTYLPPHRYPGWKGQLLAGDVDPVVAAAVGDLLGSLHAAGAGDEELAKEFASDDNFHALRIEPYLLATAAAHPALGDRLRALAERTARTRLAVVHGDVSPKNILIGPAGPVLLDAECAWYGDPAFDLAFCLNHLLLKTLVVPARRTALLDSARALTRAYLARCTWEPPAGVAHRAATLLPALSLARVDGKSPVEYLTEPLRAFVRRVVPALLRGSPPAVTDVLDAWQAALTPFPIRRTQENPCPPPN